MPDWNDDRYRPSDDFARDFGGARRFRDDRDEYAGVRGGGYLGGDYGYGIDRSYERDIPPPRPSFRGRGPKTYQRSDERIREIACERLSDHDAVDASDIEVTVSGGEVTLAGTVDDRRTKWLVEEIVANIAGVKDVDNDLKVDRNFFERMSERLREAVHRREE